MVSWDLHGTVVPASELTSYIEELSETLVLVLAYSPDILEDIVSPEFRVLNGFNISKVRKLLTQLAVGDSPVPILIEDGQQTLEFLGSQAVRLREAQLLKDITQLIEGDEVVMVHISFDEKLQDVSILE